MITGDQPPTAVGIAEKVNIMTQSHLEYNKIVDEGLHGRRLSPDEAFYECKSIVIHGDLLAREIQMEMAQDFHDQRDRTSKIMEWLKKEEVVFSRVSPSQKVFIVEACQWLGHTVAYVGDGVNDSQAIR